MAQARVAQRLDTRFLVSLFYESGAKPPCADVAQLAEQLICNQQVASSSLAVGSVASAFCARWRRAWVGYPSGQREQTVNLPASRLRRFESFPHHSEGAREGQLRADGAGVRRMRRPYRRARSVAVITLRYRAGVAQLVERKPSKLDVAGSSPVSRFGALARPKRSRTKWQRRREETNWLSMMVEGRRSRSSVGRAHPW